MLGGSTHGVRQGKPRQSLGRELSYILNTVVMRASEKLAMRAMSAELRVSHMHTSMQMPGKRIPSRGDNQYIFLETDMCPVFVTHSNQTYCLTRHPDI